ncbi:MAG TPA: hypothetical protein VN081_05145 [Dongiaceae bacterium]|nr:hypothetical protein [Dongiaceae bacterium]
MSSVIAFRPRSRDRDNKVVLTPLDDDHKDHLPPLALSGLDELMHGSPWTPGKPRPKGCLTLDIQASGMRFTLKIVTQSEVPVKNAFSYSLAKDSEFHKCYGEWAIDNKIPSPNGYLEFAKLHRELMLRSWFPANHYCPTTGLGIIFGYRRDAHNTLIVQVEYNPFYHVTK